MDVWIYTFITTLSITLNPLLNILPCFDRDIQKTIHFINYIRKILLGIDQFRIYLESEAVNVGTYPPLSSNLYFVSCVARFRRLSLT